MDRIQNDLAKLAASTPPSAMALVRRYLTEIEAAIDARVSHKAIIERIAAHGHPMTLAAFRRALVAARKATGQTKRQSKALPKPMSRVEAALRGFGPIDPDLLDDEEHEALLDGIAHGPLTPQGQALYDEMAKEGAGTDMTEDDRFEP